MIKNIVNGRRICALMLALFMLCGIAGCGGEEEAEQITLRTMSIMGDDDVKQAYTVLLEKYSAQYPNVYHLGTVAQAANAYKLYANFDDTYTASKYPHAVFYYTDTGMEELSEYFVPVEEIRQSYPDFASGITDPAFDCVRAHDGKVYCVPFAGRWTALAVNNALFAQCAAEAPDNLEKLYDAVKALRSRNIVPFADSPDGSAALLELLCVELGAENAVDALLRGDRVLSADNRMLLTGVFAEYKRLCAAGAFSDASVTEEMAEISALMSMASDSDVSLLRADTDTVRPGSIELFNEGRAAMVIVDSDTVKQITLDDYTLVMFPGRIGNEHIMVGGFNTGWYITRRAFEDRNVRDAVVAFVDMMTDENASAEFTSIGFLPSADIEPMPVQPQEEGEEPTGETPKDNGLYNLADNANGFTASRITSVHAAFFSRIEDAAAALGFGLITPEQAVDYLCDPALTLADVADVPEITVSQSDAEAEITVSGSDSASA